MNKSTINKQNRVKLFSDKIQINVLEEHETNINFRKTKVKLYFCKNRLERNIPDAR